MSKSSQWSQKSILELGAALIDAGLEQPLKEWLDRSGNAVRAVTALRMLRRGTEPVSIPRDRRTHIAAESRKGLAKSRNEDSAHCFGASNVDFLLLADGLGGHDMGDRASQIATKVGSAHLVQRIAEVGADEFVLQSLLPETMFHINVELAREMLRLSVEARRDALRTTCIISASTEVYHLLSWIGDGGAWLRRADGTIETLLKPHKGSRQNILDASLGAREMAGTPSFTHARRRSGDLIVLTTDGISDYTDVTTFINGLHRNLVQKYAGNVPETVRDVLDQVEQHRSGGRITFTDNFSLGVLSTP